MIHLGSTRKSPLPLFLISALHESGGGFITRLFDGHPELKVYPFEMQLGTDAPRDELKGYCFQPRYRWPRFSERFKNCEALHRSITDREVKRYLTNRSASKFSVFDLRLSMEDWMRNFQHHLRRFKGKMNRSSVIESYLLSFFSSWRSRLKSKKEWAVLGHCPILLFDVEAVFCDFPNSKMVHLVRSPEATFHDTKQRLPHLKPREFCSIWNLTVFFSTYCQKKYPHRFLVIRYESLIASKVKTLKLICAFLGISYSPKMLKPSWNGIPLGSINPFGGIPDPSLAYERTVRRALPKRIATFIRQLTFSTRTLYGY